MNAPVSTGYEGDKNETFCFDVKERIMRVLDSLGVTGSYN